MKRLMISIYGLLIIMIIFGTVSYAWVSMAQINNVDGISLTATSGDELQISYDGINYESLLDAYGFEDDIFLKDVTSLDGVSFTRGAHKNEGIALENKDYIAFDLHFRTTRSEKGLYIVNKVDSPTDGVMRGTYVTSDGIAFNPLVNYIEDNHRLILKNNIQTYYAKDALRISFSEIDEEQAIESTVIYDPSENALRGYGTYFGAYSYYIERTESNLELPTQLPQTTYRLSTMDPHNPYQALDNDSMIATMSESPLIEQDVNYYTARVRIHIWIEGWDADAIDGILQDKVNVQLEFKLAHPA